MSIKMTAAEFQKQFGSAASGSDTSPKKPQIRIELPPELKANKTELAWVERAKRLHPGCEIKLHLLKLKLPSGTTYTPDVFVIDPKRGPVVIYEVKGAFIHNDRSIHAFKEAKAAYPYWDFKFAQLIKGEWRVL